MASNRLRQFCLSLLIATFVVAPLVSAQIIIQLPSLRLSSVAIGDFDHDGIPDLAAVTPCGASLFDCDLGFVTLYRGDGTGNFVPSNFIDLNATISGTAVFADFYGNGNLDLVVPMLHKGLAIISGNSFPGIEDWTELPVSDSWISITMASWTCSC